MNEPNAYGNTPLHVACYNGQDVVVNELIDCGANVNQVNEKGFTPLHFAAASTHGALCLELLVCNGADVNIKVGVSKAILSHLKILYIFIRCSFFKNTCFDNMKRFPLINGVFEKYYSRNEPVCCFKKLDLNLETSMGFIM